MARKHCMPYADYVKEHKRLIKLLSVGEKLTKEMEEQSAELSGSEKRSSKKQMRGGADTALLTLTEEAQPLPTIGSKGAIANAWASERPLMDALGAVQAFMGEVSRYSGIKTPSKKQKREFYQNVVNIYQLSTPQARGVLDEAFPVNGFIESAQRGLEMKPAESRKFYADMASQFQNYDAPTNAELQGGAHGCGCGTPGCNKGMYSMEGGAFAPKLPTATELFGKKAYQSLTADEKNQLSKARADAYSQALKQLPLEQQKKVVADAFAQKVAIRAEASREGAKRAESQKAEYAYYKALDDERDKWNAIMRERANSPLGKFMTGLTKTGDFVTQYLLPVVAPGVGIAISAAYKASSRENPDSQNYKKAWEDIAKETLQDIAQVAVMAGLSRAVQAVRPISSGTTLPRPPPPPPGAPKPPANPKVIDVPKAPRPPPPPPEAPKQAITIPQDKPFVPYPSIPSRKPPAFEPSAPVATRPAPVLPPSAPMVTPSNLITRAPPAQTISFTLPTKLPTTRPIMPQVPTRPIMTQVPTKLPATRPIMPQVPTKLPATRPSRYRPLSERYAPQPVSSAAGKPKRKLRK